MKHPVYFVWYELASGAEKQRLVGEVKMAHVTKRAENGDEMAELHARAATTLFNHHGGEGLTIYITGMCYLRMEEKEIKNVKRRSSTKK